MDQNRTSNDRYDNTQVIGFTKKHPGGKAADFIAMPDSNPEALAATVGVKVGDLLIYPAPSFNRITVEDANGKTYRDAAAVQVIFSTLRGLAAQAKDGDVAAAIRAATEAI
jgi:hypothetical protein